MYDVNIYTNCIDTQRDGFDKESLNVLAGGTYSKPEALIKGEVIITAYLFCSFIHLFHTYSTQHLAVRYP